MLKPDKKTYRTPQVHLDVSFNDIWWFKSIITHNFSGKLIQYRFWPEVTEALNHSHILPAIPVILDFNQNLAQNHLSEASKQLLEQEMHHFNPQSPDKEINCTEDEEDSLQKDYETLMLHLRMAVHDSFNKENQERLKSAVTAILQQEEQDRYWEEVTEEKRPRWRPLKCKDIHDTLLKEVVEVRLQQANEEENGADKLSTSLKREVCRMGRRIQKDLLQVVRDVQQCYPSEFDVCKMYVQLYHQAFSTKLLEFARSSIEIQDCIYILCWIHVYYPK